MKILYLFRPAKPGNFSFENIFNSVSKELSKLVQIDKYECSSFFDFSSIFKMPILRADLYHITGGVNYLALTLPWNKTILTLHDVGFYENPVNQGLKRRIYEWLWLRLPLRLVKRVTVVSEFTKEKVQRLFDVAPEKIKVIPNPLVYELAFEPKSDRSTKLQIIQIGSGSHKNLKGLILATKALPVHLIIVGRISPTDRQLLNEASTSFDNYFNVSQDVLIDLYRQADLLYFASFYEGFGMPIIEAQAIGRPVITSNFGAMKEVSGGHAIFVDPHDTESIKSAIMQILCGAIDEHQLVLSGLKNSEKYKLDNVAAQYLALYQELANG